jgi:predicted chitinase
MMRQQPAPWGALAVMGWLLGCAGTPVDGPTGGGGEPGTGGGAGVGGGSGGQAGGGAGAGGGGSGGARTGGSGGGGAGAGGSGGGGSGGSSGTGGGGSGGTGGTGGSGGTGGVKDAAPDLPRDVATTPPPGCGFATVVSRAAFDGMFPTAGRNSLYTYDGLVAASQAFEGFTTTGDANTCKKEAAAFLANVAHETERLRYAEEINKSAYCDSRADCPCNAGDQSRWYYGRGPLQLSWNYNYCAAGRAIGSDLGAQPGLVSSNSEIAWKTGLWFWMTQRGAGITTAHLSITGDGGFGGTISSLNGGLECNKGGYPSQPQVKQRVDYYLDFARRLGVTNVGTAQDNDC